MADDIIDQLSYYVANEMRMPAGLIVTVIDEIKRLRQGLWDCAVIAGVDTDGDSTPQSLAFPDIVEFAQGAVRRLREDCDE